jgi:hypothetical protein
LFLIVYCVAVRRAAIYLSTEHGGEAMWPLVCLTFVLLYQVTESTIFVGNTIFWILYTSVVCSLAVVPAFHSAEAEVGDAKIAELRPNLQFNRGHV